MVKLVDNPYVVNQFGSETEVKKFVSNISKSRVKHALGVLLLFNDGKLNASDAFKEITKFLELTDFEKQVKYNGGEVVVKQRIANVITDFEKDGLGYKSNGVIYLTEKGKDFFDEYID